MTDHKAEAIRVSQLAHDNADEENWDRAVHQMLRAQMHATLYLAEQQRIANLLAFAQFHLDGPDNSVLATSFDGAIELRTEAAEALGVNL